MHNYKEIPTVVKYSGKVEAFSEDKLQASLRHAGVEDQVARSVVEQIRSQLYPGISTRKIYKIAKNLVAQRNHFVASRYSLKRAIFELGPSGFPFEKLTAAIFSSQGFLTKTDILQFGRCISHELDVLAESDTQLNWVECKFHQRQGVITDIKTTLYIKARYEDLKGASTDGRNKNFWLVSNTRFSGDSHKFAECAGLNLLGWDFPYGDGIKDLVNRFGLFPVTCLSFLTRAQKDKLLSQDVVLCLQLRTRLELLERLGFSAAEIELAMKELDALLPAHRIQNAKVKNFIKEKART